MADGPTPRPRDRTLRHTVRHSGRVPELKHQGGGRPAAAARTPLVSRGAREHPRGLTRPIVAVRQERTRQTTTRCLHNSGGTRLERERQRWHAPNDRKRLCVCAVQNKTLIRQSSSFSGTRQRTKRPCQCASNEISGRCPSSDRSRRRITDRFQVAAETKPAAAIH
jgi:hypothetical protein